MANKSSAYWKKRFEQLEAAQNKQGLSAYSEIESQYRQAQRTIEGQITAWYQRFADNNNISMSDAKKMLTSKELAEFKWDVNDYIKYGEENALSGTWTKQLENASARYHISRLEALKIETQQSVEALFGNQLDTIDSAMKSIYTSGYYHTAFEIQKGVGVGWDFTTLDDKTISKVINTPWAVDGKNFSERIWGSKEKLINELNQTLTQNIILGQDPQKAIDAIAKKMNVSKANAGRLVMTEEAYFSSEAQKDCFNELDVEMFEIVATLDNLTSDICQGMDGKVFKMSEWEVGVTAPPFHPNCRTTTVPAFGDEFDKIGERAARSEHGKTYQVPADTTYKEWEEAFIKGDKSALQEIKKTDTVKDKKVTFVSTVEEAKTALTDTVGFDMVESSFGSVADELAVSNTNQLIKLENKFGAVHKSTGTICSVKDTKTTVAYVSSTSTNPYNQNLSLCPNSYKNASSLIDAEKRAIERGWNMPAALTNEELSVYTVTHEYGHLIQNVLIGDKMKSLGWTAENPRAFVDITKRSRASIYKWYNDVRKSVQNDCFSEIMSIAKEANKDFSLASNISEYGKTNKAEFFAEVFANSQLSEPNELGKAMNVWLERKGLVQ